MLYVQVSLNRSEMEKITVQVAPWEVEILKAVHGDDRVEVTGETAQADREYPDADSEYNRLLTRYKSDIEQGNSPYVEQIFGAGAAGVRALEQAIVDAQEAELNPPEEVEEEAPKPKAKAKAKTAPKKAPAKQAAKPEPVEPEPIDE